MTKAEIARGLEDWSEKMAGAAQFRLYLEKREREIAAARRASEQAMGAKVPRLGGRHRTVPASGSRLGAD